MIFTACAHITQGTNSFAAGQETATKLIDGMGCLPELAFVYLTLNHDQQAYLSGVRESLGPDIPILGCSAQGVMGPGVVREEGYIAGAMGFAGDGLQISWGWAEKIMTDPYEKGRRLGQQLQASQADAPSIAVLIYDPLCGVDTAPLLKGLSDEIECPIIGGGAGHYFGPMQTTYQYFDNRISSGAAIAFRLSGSLAFETASFSGCEPVGIEMTVTRADGNVVLELDGRPALDVWKEICSSGPPNSDHTASLALGVPSAGRDGEDACLLRAAFGIDETRGGVVLQSAIAEESLVMLHHRTVEAVRDGFHLLGETLLERIGNRRLRAVLAFQCGALTEPFLGSEETLRLNKKLQHTLGDPRDWLGLVTWGEIYSPAGQPLFLNYCYPVLAIAD